MKSIRNNLLVWLLTGLTVAGVLAGIATFFRTQEEVGEMFDYQLQQVAYSMRYPVQSMANQFEGMVGIDQNEDNDFMVQVWDVNGRLLYSSLGSVKLPASSKTGFLDVKVSENKWRIFSLATNGRIIQAGQPISSRDEVSIDMALHMLLPLAILIPILAALILFAIKKSLFPLSVIASEVERRDASSMTPLEINSVPREIHPLLAAINSLLKRLDSSISSQRRFVADAAHELRTPLTALSLQVDLVEQAEDSSERTEAIDKLRNGIKRSSHLVNQLLTLARQEPEAQWETSRFDLSALVNQVADEFIPISARKHIKLNVDANQPVIIEGNSEGLKVVVGNLIDNAIRYTPEGGAVEVSVNSCDRNAELIVRDTGPGIPEVDRDRIFERFYRIPGNDVTGSGLGLSIASQIVERHKAAISVTEGIGGRGAAFIIKFRTT